MRRWVLAGLAGVALAAAGPLHAGAPGGVTPPQAIADPERLLQAVRQALIDSTLGAPVRVQSYGWIDAEGRLHESTQFTADAKVRGVRLPTYVEDPVAAAAAKVRVETVPLPNGLGSHAAGDPARCLASPGRWRLSLHVEAPVRNPHPVAVRQARAAEQAFLAAARESRRWMAQPLPAQGATVYERALAGRDLDRTDWLARVALHPSGPGLSRLQVEVTPQREPTRARRLELDLPADDPAALEAAMADVVAALDRDAACEPLGYAVVAQGDSLRLREGAAHGLQPGDRLLLVERQHLPGRLLEPGAARALAIVQVERTGQAGTPLRWLAGPRPPQAGDWVALPL